MNKRHDDSNRTPRQESESFAEIIGQSDAINSVFMRVDQVAPLNVTVLLLGETGTGKGLIARTIHRRSARKNRPMVTVNCASLPSNRIESEIFGRGRRAATESDACQIGRFELANGSTIFVDEIGAMPLELQCKLLRVLQDGEFERLGSSRLVKIDVRIIAASNRNLEELTVSGRFRHDLFYRLNVFAITIPPLRERPEDIEPLTARLLEKICDKMGRYVDSIAPAALNALRLYPWPGNIRELENVLERAVTLIGPERVIQLHHLPDNLGGSPNPDATPPPLQQQLEQCEAKAIADALRQTGGNKAKTAQLLHISRSNLYERMQRLKVSSFTTECQISSPKCPENRTNIPELSPKRPENKTLRPE